ncbi:hypothetical protein FF1_009467 [Malus domestica]
MTPSRTSRRLLSITSTWKKPSFFFNLGAVYSQIGLSYPRATVDGRLQASHTFIEVAEAFTFLRDNAATKASIGSSTTMDSSVECAGMLDVDHFEHGPPYLNMGLCLSVLL